MKKGTNNVFRGIRRREIGTGRSSSAHGILGNYADFISAKYSSKITPLSLSGNVRSTFLVSFSHDSALMASTHGNHQIYVWEVRSGDCIQTLAGHPRTPWTIAFHPSSTEVLASGCLGGEVRVWDLQGSSEVWCSPSRTTITSLSFHPRDRLLAVATNNQIFLWDWNEPSPFTSVQTSSDKETVRLVRFDSQGHYLLTGIANLIPEYDQQDTSNSDENTQDSSNQGSEESDPEPLEPDTYPVPSIPEPAIPRDVIQAQPSRQEEDPSPRPISPESMDTLEQAREYAASVTLNALRSRHQRGFDIVSSTANPGPSATPSYPAEFAPPGLRYSTRYSMSSQEGAHPGRSRTRGGSREHRRHSVESLSNLANLVWSQPTNSVSQMSQNVGNEFALSRPPPVVAESTSPHNETPQEINIPSDDSDPAREDSGSSGREDQAMVEVEGDVRVSVMVHRTGGASRSRARMYGTSDGPVSARQSQSSQGVEPSGTHLVTARSHAQSARGRSMARYQAQLSRRLFSSTMGNSSRRFTQGLSMDHPLSREGEDSIGPALPEGPRRRRVPQLSRHSRQAQLNIPGHRYGSSSSSSSSGDQPLSRQGEEDGQSGEGLRRRRPSRFGFHRTALRRRVLHSHYSTSLFDNTQPPSPYVHYAINRAIAHALAGSGQMALANNISNRTHRLQWWDISDYVLPDISDAQSNVIVAECKIHNDASVDISQDRRLAAFIPSHMGFPDHGILAVCSLEKHNLGDVLFTKSFGPNAVTVNLSPTGNYILVGLAARRLHWQMFHGLMAEVYQLQKPEAGEDSMTFINRIIHPLDHQQRLVVSVNIASWIPRPGAGLVYGTNRGDLCLCTPQLDNEDEPAANERKPPLNVRAAEQEPTSRPLDMVERRRSYSELGMVPVRLSNSQSTGTTGDPPRSGAVPERRAQATQTGNNVVQNTGTQTDFGNAGHVAGRERIGERRSDISEALRSGGLMAGAGRLEGRDNGSRRASSARDDALRNVAQTSTGCTAGTSQGPGAVPASGDSGMQPEGASLRARDETSEQGTSTSAGAQNEQVRASSAQRKLSLDHCFSMEGDERGGQSSSNDAYSRPVHRIRSLVSTASDPHSSVSTGHRSNVSFPDQVSQQSLSSQTSPSMPRVVTGLPNAKDSGHYTGPSYTAGGDSGAAPSTSRFPMAFHCVGPGGDACSGTTPQNPAQGTSSTPPSQSPQGAPLGVHYGHRRFHLQSPRVSLPLGEGLSQGRPNHPSTQVSSGSDLGGVYQEAEHGTGTGCALQGRDDDEDEDEDEEEEERLGPSLAPSIPIRTWPPGMSETLETGLMSSERDASAGPSDNSNITETDLPVMNSGTPPSWLMLGGAVGLQGTSNSSEASAQLSRNSETVGSQSVTIEVDASEEQGGSSHASQTPKPAESMPNDINVVSPS
ncbi:activating molecule in BECN1-regulated autophagy protein 1A-like [Diadema setosum]|uniref:activating molecule in BECN1-regulated autophagy protein 1A-like n=1 Tax=Diadema setosum TaxID=31175 RepID=UPI003B3A2979